MERARAKAKVERRDEVESPVEQAKRELLSIIGGVSKELQDETIFFGSSARTLPHSQTPAREANDIDVRTLSPDEATARRAAMRVHAALVAHGIPRVSYEIASVYGNCPRLAYETNDGIPVEIFFENKESSAGMFGGLSAKELESKREGETLSRMSRAQDVRSLLISILRESEQGGTKENQRFEDLTQLMTRLSPSALLRLQEHGRLEAWLSAGNPQLQDLIERNRPVLNRLLEELRRQNTPQAANDNTPEA